MSKGLIFFCCACAILLFTIINLSIGPIINHKTYMSGTENCAILSDGYDLAKKGALTDSQKKYKYEWDINRCKRKKAMYNMEYTSFIFNVVIGFVSGLLGLLHLFDAKKELVPKTGLIGLGCGIVGFVLTFVYVILNGLVFTNYYDNTIYKRDSDGAFAELDSGNKYKCLYYDDDPLNVYSFYAKYSDLGKKQYNYDKDYLESVSEGCKQSASSCLRKEYYTTTTALDDNGNACKFLYELNAETDITNKDKFDRFLTVLILSLFICFADLALALFGFLLFKGGEF